MSETEPRDVADALQRMTEQQVQCRDYGHSWKPWRAELFGKGGAKGYERALRCARCGTERWQTLTRYGEVVSGHYIYPDGYLVKGLGRLTGEDRGLVRIASIERTLRHD
jgi:hypothetical protein